VETRLPGNDRSTRGGPDSIAETRCPTWCTRAPRDSLPPGRSKGVACCTAARHAVSAGPLRTGSLVRTPPPSSLLDRNGPVCHWNRPRLRAVGTPRLLLPRPFPKAGRFHRVGRPPVAESRRDSGSRRTQPPRLHVGELALARQEPDEREHRDAGPAARSARPRTARRANGAITCWSCRWTIRKSRCLWTAAAGTALGRGCSEAFRPSVGPVSSRRLSLVTFRRDTDLRRNLIGRAASLKESAEKPLQRPPKYQVRIQRRRRQGQCQEGQGRRARL
jgi:hypothetical protein